MSRKIFKFALEVVDSQIISIQKGAQPLSVQFQAGQLCMWAAVNPAAWVGGREVLIYGTGHSITDVDSLEQVGTVQDGPLVWHVFIKKEIE